MRQLGGYELQRNLGGVGTAQLWQGRDSASEQPALLFVLPAAYLLNARPDLGGRHPALLPFARSGVAEVPGEGREPGGRAAYLSSLLPPTAEPVRSLNRAGLLALLEALATLHRAGAVHGSICPELLWQDQEHVYLAGAGVPWQGGAGSHHPPDFAQDVRGLGQALGGVREAPDLPAGWLPALRAATGPQAAQELWDRWQGCPAPGESAAPHRPAPTAPRKTGPAAPAVAGALRAAVRPETAAAPRAPLGQPRGVSPWPWLLTSLVLLGALGSGLWAYQNLSVPGAPQEPPQCCEVRYTVRGGEVPVRLQVLEAPPLLTVPTQQAEISAPGTMQLPGPGEYRIRVSADGYAPQTISVTVPRSLPVAIALE